MKKPTRYISSVTCYAAGKKATKMQSEKERGNIMHLSTM